MPGATWEVPQGRVNVSECIMRSYQQMLLILSDNSTNLLIQISELNELRERVRKAEQSAPRKCAVEAAEKNAA